MAEHNELGKQGEELAVAFLKKLGYKILEVNWRSEKYEIDIIARDKGTLVIVEVKSRRNNVFTEPEASVTRQKQKSLIAAANSYIFRNRILDETRFDIIAIILNEEGHQVTHLIDAFYPTLR